jgi:hypothetical protein
MSTYQAPPAPDYAAANVAGVQADAATLPFRLAVSQAANLGKKWTDPATGKSYDFTGLGMDAQNAASIEAAMQLMRGGSDIALEAERKRLQGELELLPEFNRLNLAQQQEAIDQALAASQKFTANSYQQNLDFMPKLGELQRAENEKAFSQNLDLGKRGTFETAAWQQELLPALNRTYTTAQADSHAAATEAGRLANPTAYATRDALGAQIAAELAKGRDMTDDQRNRYTEQVRGAQAARGNVLGDSAAFEEALKLTEYGDTLQKDRQGAALSFINSRDLGPTFQTVGAVNPLMPNFGATQTMNPQVPNLAATTTTAPNLNPAGVAPQNPLAFLNPSAGQNSATYAGNIWQQQFQRESEQVNPWMAGLGMLTGAAGAAGGVGKLFAGI